jgi:hypothetical protein
MILAAPRLAAITAGNTKIPPPIIIFTILALSPRTPTSLCNFILYITYIKTNSQITPLKLIAI